MSVRFSRLFRAITSIETTRPQSTSPQNTCIALADICSRARSYTYTLSTIISEYSVIPAQLLVIEMVLKPSNTINQMLVENIFLSKRAGLLLNRSDTSAAKV